MAFHSKMTLGVCLLNSVFGIVGLLPPDSTQVLTLQRTLALQHKETLTSMALAQDGQTLLAAVCNDEGNANIVVWDLRTGRERQVLKTKQAMIMSLAVTDDRKILASASRDGTLAFWNLKTLSVIGKSKVKLEMATPVCFQANSKRLISQKLDGTPVVWNTEDWDNVRPLVDQPFQGADSYSGFALSKNGQWIVTATGKLAETNDILLFDLRSGKKLGRYKGPNNVVNAFAFASDGSRVAVGFLYGNRNHKMIQMWNTSTGKLLASLDHKGAVSALTFSPDNSMLVAGNNGGRISVWQTKTNDQNASIAAHNDQVFDLIFSDNGEYMISGSYDNTIKVWKVENR